MPRITLEELATAMESDDPHVRWRVMKDYAASRYKPTLESLPILRRALYDSDVITARLAAYAIAKLGPDAHQAVDDLFVAAELHKRDHSTPLNWPQCIETLAAVAPLHPQLIPIIKDYCLKHSNWVPISASLRALKVINTPEAHELLCETLEFWRPQLNKMQLRVAERLRSESEAAIKANAIIP